MRVHETQNVSKILPRNRIEELTSQEAIEVALLDLRSEIVQRRSFERRVIESNEGKRSASGKADKDVEEIEIRQHVVLSLIAHSQAPDLLHRWHIQHDPRSKKPRIESAHFSISLHSRVRVEPFRHVQISLFFVVVPITVGVTKNEQENEKNEKMKLR